MLRALDIRDMLIIDRLDLAFEPGLNVLTGETGAGKSILLDSLGFVLGWRGRADLVRQGASQGEVVAVFDLSADHPARAVLDEAGLPVEDELVLRRINTAEGRKTAWVNDRRSSGEVLRALSATLVELHGQYDDRGLLNARGHKALLDAYGGESVARALSGTQAAWKAWKATQKRLEAAQAALAALREEEDFLRHAVDEMDRLDPQPGEDGELDAARRRMQGAARIRDDVARAHDLLGTNGAESAMGDALRWLDGVAAEADGTLEEPMAALNRALIELGEAQTGVEQGLANLQFDPAELEACEERLFAIRALARKHDTAPDDLGIFADSLRARLAALDSGSGDVAALESETGAAAVAYEKAAARLSSARQSAAGRLDAEISGELAPLRMERAVFETVLTPSEPGPDGQESVAFTVAPSPGAPGGPINRIASGGELSRFLLALKVCLSGQDGNATMIFDEIDRGVGGATADAVGRRLARLAADGQVLVVTHSPQVAALGAHHWQVSKHVEGEETLSTVTALTGDARVDELARMLAGEQVTDEARAAARALLDA